MDIIALMNCGGLSRAPVMLSPDDGQRLAMELAPKVAQPQPQAAVRCPDCNGSGQYVGIGFAPAEACRLCGGKGKVTAQQAGAPARLDVPTPSRPLTALEREQALHRAMERSLYGRCPNELCIAYGACGSPHDCEAFR